MPSNMLRWTVADTAVGPALVVVGPAGVREVRLRETLPSAPDATDGAMPEPPLGSVRDDAGLADVAAAVRDLVRGARRDFPFPLDLSGHASFYRRVWEELLHIPWGTTATYGEIARRVGSGPQASRAVGQACGRNPLAIVVPCHRVLAANGALGGYGGGLQVKRRLLAVEGVSVA